MNKNVKRIAAMIGLVLFASLILVTLISAFFASEKAPGFFIACLFSIIVIPIMIWAFMLVYRLVHRNDPRTDMDTADSDADGSTEEDDIPADRDLSEAEDPTEDKE